MTDIALIHWNEDSNQYVKEAVNAVGASFNLDGDAIIEVFLSLNKREITIHSTGPITIRPDISNQIFIGVLRP